MGKGGGGDSTLGAIATSEGGGFQPSGYQGGATGTSDVLRSGYGGVGSEPYTGSAVELPKSDSGRDFNAAGFAEEMGNMKGYNPGGAGLTDIANAPVPGSGGTMNFQNLPPFALAADLRRGPKYSSAGGTNADMITQFLAALGQKGAS